MPSARATAPTVLNVSRIRPESAHFQVRLGVEPLGTFEQTSKGFVVNGCRKALATIDDAAREVAFRRSKQSLREAARFVEAMEFPVSVDAVDPHACSTGTLSTRA